MNYAYDGVQCYYVRDRIDVGGGAGSISKLRCRSPGPGKSLTAFRSFLIPYEPSPLFSAKRLAASSIIA